MNDTKRLCLADFDDTLILTDSLKSIMRRERWLMSPALFAAGVRLFICKRTSRRELDARNRFKKHMMLKYRDLPSAKKEQYYQELRGKINTSVITNIREKHFDRIAIVSASEEELIRQVLGDTLGEIEIIANIIPGTKIPSVQNEHIVFKQPKRKHSTTVVRQLIMSSSAPATAPKRSAGSRKQFPITRIIKLPFTQIPTQTSH